jgi:hypothetical protein
VVFGRYELSGPVVQQGIAVEDGREIVVDV